MNIKSLLLGSAAALVAVSGARAADAVNVAAEPEPAEYVRVCDTYGTGYFYIPGTETCLRIGGYVRVDFGMGDGPYGGHEVNGDDTYHNRARLSLRTWTGSETELGTLSTFTETRFNYQDENHGAGIDPITLNFAWVQLGGFRVGKDESAFTTFAGYAGGVIADDMIAYGNFDTNLISYTLDAGNGFSGIIALEMGEAGSAYEIDSYMPHVVAGAKYAGGWGAATGVFGYDSVNEEWAGKVRVDVNVNEQISLFVMGGYGTEDNGSSNNYKPWKGNWAVWGGGSFKVNDKATVNAQVSYDEGNGDDGDLAVAANVDYELVKGLHVIPEVTYSDYAGVNKSAPDSEGFGGYLRFQRNF
ncbi:MULTISPECIES: porin [Mesorhizobium]|uniref:Porin n=1 Tax=Mesorhizobium denitrificans TaxID=2294114 RepID=A0A371XIV4_9HYPH|nr:MULTISPECIES: porin [Mesorhizobium]RFC69150.1 porin [Mesorhizobium denitrificans]